MASLESQQWYIEEIPPTCDVPSEVGAVDSSASMDVKLEYAGAKLTALDIDPVALAAGTCQGRDTSKSGNTEQAPFGVVEVQARCASGGSWACKTIATSSSSRRPVPRGGCSWTKVGSKYLLFGGADAYQQHFADVHCFDEAAGTWEKASIGGTPPSARSGHSAIALGKSLVVYGGMNGQDGVTFNDLFELRIGEGSMEWISLPCKDAPPRNSHAAVIHENTMIIIGGASPEGQTNEVYTIDLSDRSSLTCRQVCCKPWQSAHSSAHSSRQSDEGRDMPVAREMHSTCLYGSRTTKGAQANVLLMGGRSKDGVLPDLFSLTTGSWEWRRLKDAPVPRCAHSACFVGDSGIMAIHGGWDGGNTVANDLHLYDTQCGDWTTPNVSPRPVGRFAHAACADGRKSLLIFGGVNPGEDLADVVMLTAP